ncbi:MAG: YraN family protein [Bacteroidetes bacterium]|nr:YraN family protein [Bacteroidota bacterium]
MVDAKELGKLGEKLAAEELSKKGYKLLTKNFFYDHKEVDIICEHEGQIVFVEVKTRMSPYLSDPALLVPIKKQRQIIKVADFYLKEFFPDYEARFDIIIVITNNEYTRQEHIVDAFYPMV